MRKVFFFLKDYLLLIFLLLVSLFLISLDSSPEAAKPKKIFFGTFAFANSLFNSIFVEPINFASCKTVSKRAAELNLENEKLRVYGLENTELKKLLAYKQNNNFSLRLAQIIGKNLQPTKSNFIIDKGTKDGIGKGMTVVSAQGFLGIITDAAENYSVVRTFEDGKMKITAELERTGINGLLTWNGKDLVMKNIPTNYDVKKGDRVITSPLSLRYVHRIPVGLVKEKIVSVSGLFADLIITPFNDLRTIRYCFIIENSDNTLLNKQIQESKQ